jgi:hypothetical protein
MSLWRRDDVTAVSAQVDPLVETGAISGQAGGMGKI